MYFDEYFWVHSFQTLRKVASGMAIHKKWRQTYFSTPSALSHDAYPFWSGSLFNKGRAKADRITMDTSHAALVNGLLCADGQWRQIVTVLDAMAGGCDLFDLEQLRLEYSADEFLQLLMSEFIDDSASVFPFALVKRCMVDSWEVWDDVRPYAPRPLGDAPVSIGFDPSKGASGGDPSGCTVNALPASHRDLFRVVEKHQWPGQDFDAQAGNIKRLGVAELIGLARVHLSAARHRCVFHRLIFSNQHCGLSEITGVRDFRLCKKSTANGK